MVQSNHMPTNIFPRQCIFTTNWTKLLHVTSQIAGIAAAKSIIFTCKYHKKSLRNPGGTEIYSGNKKYEPFRITWISA
jgi:hypothetical protein